MAKSSGRRAKKAKRVARAAKTPSAARLDIENVGTAFDKIKVELDPKLLELFAVGLYRSPTKAVEELVTNSFDAQARRALVQLPSDATASDATIWVADDGEGMDADGLRHLWMIGRSNKRDHESRKRPPIGKFGIGKLATFVLGTRLTYVSKSAEGYLAVTMDFDRSLQPSSKPDRNTQDILLDLRRLTEAEARIALRDIRGVGADSSPALLPLFGTDAAATWTVAAIRGLKPLGQSISAGRLRRVLSITMPLGGVFKIWLDSEAIVPERLNVKPVQQWTIGADDDVAERMGLSVDTTVPGIVIPGIKGVVRGEVVVYDGPVTKGKSEQWGRSNGFFVRVRGRVVNLDDPLFGLPALSHTTFAAFRMEVEADGLDDFLRSSRESVEERDEVERLREYLRNKFSEARVYYDKWLDDRQFEGLLSTRLDRTPASLSRIPLLDAIYDVVGGGDELYLTRIPSFTKKDDGAAFLSNLQAQSVDGGLFGEVRLEPIGWDRPIAEYDAGTRLLRVNELHPFYANYAGQFKSLEPFELIAATEVLTEAYLREAGVPPNVAREAMMRRDRFLRALVLSQQPTVPLVLQMLREKGLDDELMRTATQSAFSCLGFEVTRLAGRSAPNGLAAARGSEGANYAVAVYAATTDRWTNLTKLASPDRLAKQMQSYQANYACIVVPETPRLSTGAPSADDLREFRDDMRRRDALVLSPTQLGDVLVTAATRGLELESIEDFFRTCRTSSDVQRWLEGAQSTTLPRIPIRELLDLIWGIQQERQERVQVGMVVERAKPGPIRSLKTSVVLELLRSLRRFAGPSITVDGVYVTLEATPETILTNLVASLNSLPRSAIEGDPFVIRKKDLPAPHLIAS